MPFLPDPSIDLGLMTNIGLVPVGFLLFLRCKVALHMHQFLKLNSFLLLYLMMDFMLKVLEFMLEEDL
jgi:hypothetical protein